MFEESKRRMDPKIGAHNRVVHQQVLQCREISVITSMRANLECHRSDPLAKVWIQHPTNSLCCVRRVDIEVIVAAVVVASATHLGIDCVGIIGTSERDDVRIWAAALFFFFFPEESEIVICGMGLRLRPRGSRCDRVFTSFEQASMHHAR